MRGGGFDATTTVAAIGAGGCTGAGTATATGTGAGERAGGGAAASSEADSALPETSVLGSPACGGGGCGTACTSGSVLSIARRFASAEGASFVTSVSIDDPSVVSRGPASAPAFASAASVGAW